MALNPLNNINESISEVEAAQDPLSAFNRMFSDVNTGIPTNPYPVINAPIPRTTSNAVDINQNLVGNEVTGPAPGVNNTTPQGNKSFVDSALDYMDNAETWAKDEYKYGKTYSYGAGYKNMQFERFYTHPNYKKLGFSPYRNNEEIYNENSTWLDDWRRSSSQYWKLLSNGFGSSVFGSDDFKAAETMQEGLALGSSSKEGIGSSITNFGLSSQYVLGMGAEMLVENVALGFVEAGALALAPVTAGATLGVVGAAAVRQTANVARFGEGLKKTYDFVKSLRQIEKAREVFTLAKAGKVALAAGKYLNPLQKSLEFTSFLAKSERVWSSTEKLALTAHGFGHFFKDLREISLVVEEAGLEGAMARSEYHQKLIDEYYAKNGKMPEGADAESIYQKGASVDFSVSMANLAVIYLSNKIVFGKYLKGFPTMSSITKSIEKNSERYLKKTAAGEVLEKGAYELVEKSGKQKFGEAFLSSPYVPWSREYFAANMTEALQENTQDAISTAVKSYHDKIDKDPSVAGFWEGVSQFGTGVKGQFNKQGLETFLSGYFTGFLVGGIGGTATNIATSIQSRTKSGKAKVQAAKERRTERENIIKDSVNVMAMDAINIGARNATSASEVKNHAEESDKAASEGNHYKYNSSKDKMFTDHSYNLAAANKTELFTSHIDDMLNLQDEDLTKAYGAKLDEAQDVRKRLNNAKERALDIKNTYEQVKEEFPNPVDLSMLDPSKDQVLYDRMVAKYKAHEFAIKTITTSTEALKRTNGRLIGIVNDFSQASPWINVRRGAQQVNNAGASDITALMDGYQREELIKVLKLEISTLKEGTAEQKKEAKIKQEKLEALESWGTIVFRFNQLGEKREALLKEKNQDLSEVTDYINLLTKEIYPIFDKYTKVIAKEQGGTLISKELGKAFIKIRDYHLLESDSNSYIAALNILNDPLYFDRFISAVEIAEEELEKTKGARIAEGYTKFMGYLDLEEYNDFLNEIFDHGMFVIPESIEEFVKDPRTAKFSLYNTAKKEPVLPGTPDYEVFEKILNERYPVKEPVVEESATGEGSTEGRAISINDNINDIPKELQDELIAAFEDLKEFYANERPTDTFPFFNFQQFLLRSGKAKQIVENYNKENGLVAKPAQATKTEPVKASVAPVLAAAPVSTDTKADIEKLGKQIQKLPFNTINKLGNLLNTKGAFKEIEDVANAVAYSYYTDKNSDFIKAVDAELAALKDKVVDSGVDAKADIERRRQEELNSLGQKQVTHNFERLEEDRNKSPKTQLSIIGSIELAQRAGAKLTKEQQNKVDSIKSDLKKQGYEVVDTTLLNTVVHEGTKVINEVVQASDENTILNEEQIKAVEKELERRSKKEAKLRKIGASEEDIQKELDFQKNEPISIVQRIIKPQVTKDGKLEQAAEVATIIIEANEAQALIDKSKLAKKESYSDKINAKYDAELDALEGKKEEVKPTEFKVGDKVKVNTPKDGEGIIKEDRGDKVLLDDGRQVFKKNLTLITEASASVILEKAKPVEEVTNLSVEEVKERLKALNEKTLQVSEDDKNYYADTENPEDLWKRVTALKKKKGEFKGDNADRGTVIDGLLRRFIKGLISSIEDMNSAYEDEINKLRVSKAKRGEEYDLREFKPKLLEDLFSIFQEVKAAADKEGLELISEIPTLWGVLLGQKAAGTIDLLGINKKGEVFIIDLKTSTQNRRDPEGEFYESYKDSDSFQQSAYAELFRQRTGITIKNVVIFPVQVKAIKTAWIKAEANKDNGKFTMPVTIDRSLFPEQSLAPEAAEIQEVLQEEVEPTPDWFISDKEAVRNTILTKLIGIEERMKIERTPDILDEINKLEDLALKADLPSVYINQISDITKRIKSEFKSISRIQIGDYIIFELNPTAKFEVVDKNENELMLYNQALPMEDRLNTEPEIVTKKDSYKISKVISAGEVETVELTPEEKEINKVNASSMEDLLKDDEAIKKDFNSTESVEEVQKELFDDLDNCAIK